MIIIIIIKNYIIICISFLFLRIKLPLKCDILKRQNLGKT